MHDLGLEKFSIKNARLIGGKIGNYLETEEEVESVQKFYIRIKVEVNVDEALMDGFRWTNLEGKEQWTSIKYERLSDFCYGRGRLGHTTQVCREDMVMSEANPGHPMYGPWMMSIRLKPK